MDIRNKKLLYHLTKLDNLDSILENGLLSRKSIKEGRFIFGDVANSEIITKRTKLGLDNYIPFHFHPYSSFDNAVKNTYTDVDFIYICIQRELARNNQFKILPMHPLSIEDFQLFDYDEGFAAIDWDSMESYGTEDEYTKHVKMAECLTELSIPAKHFQAIYVRDEHVLKFVEKTLKDRGITTVPPYVNVQKWF